MGTSRRVGAIVLAAVLLASCSSGGGERHFRSAKPINRNGPVTEQGKALGQKNIAQFEKLVDRGLNKGDLTVMDEVLSPTVVDHQFYGPGYPASRGGIKALTAALRTAFPDLHATAKMLVATNDGTQTFAIIQTTGTMTGPYLGVKANGSKIDLDIIESARWDNGIMVEHWGVADNIALLSQMGFFPPDAIPAYTVDNTAVRFRRQLDDPTVSDKVPRPPNMGSTTGDKNAAILKLFFDEGMSSGNLGVADAYVSPSYVDDSVLGAGYPRVGPDVPKALMSTFGTAFPNLHDTFEQIAPIGDGSDVFLFGRAAGTNTGAFLGIPPSGRSFKVDFMEHFTLQDGKIVRRFGITDILGLLDDLGFIPPGAVPVYKASLVDPQFAPFLKD